MKNNALAVALLGMLLVSTLITAALTYRYIASLRKLRGLQPAMVQINYSRNLIQALINETQEYSKKYPSLDSLIQPFAQKNSPAASASTPARPATK